MTETTTVEGIDLSPFEPCAPQFREYLTWALDIQAPGPRHERGPERAPDRRDDIQCRRCGRTPDQTRDDVDRRPAAFTCSGCFMVEADAYDRPAIDAECALNGQHAPASPWATECPALRAQRAPEGIETSVSTYHTGGPETSLANPHEQRGFETGFYPLSIRRGSRRGGRPRKHASDIIARREARRAYRERQKNRPPGRT